MFDDGLKCSVPGCKKVIHAITGLQEIQKLQAHMRRAHAAHWDMNETLENRVSIENMQDAGKLPRKEK